MLGDPGCNLFRRAIGPRGIGSLAVRTTRARDPGALSPPDVALGSGQCKSLHGWRHEVHRVAHGEAGESRDPLGHLAGSLARVLLAALALVNDALLKHDECAGWALLHAKVDCLLGSDDVGK